ncbi:MAG: hypothetical protein KY394_03035 [Actinobacteria bacterium]|nr:hypothetical protein [Actinomycetota bacterium]
MLSLLAVFAAACGSGGEGATPSTDTSSTSATETTSAETTTAETTTGETGTAAESCPAEQRSALSDDWEYLKFTDLFSSDFLFFLPPDWVDQPPASFPAGDAFHPDNLSEAGLDPDATVQPIAVTHPSQLPGVSLLTLTEVTSPLHVVYARQEDHIRAGTGTDVQEILRTGMRTCLGGQTAMGLELLLDGDIYTQAWTTVRAGTLYQFVLVAEDEAQADVLDEILRSWAWDQAAVEAAAAADAAAAAAATTEMPSICEPDPPTDMSAGWSRLTSEDFAFSHPGDWQDLSGAVTLAAAGFLDEETYAETGLAPDATFTSTLVRDPSGFPNVSVFRFEGVQSPLDEVHGRLQTHLDELPEVEGVTPSTRPLCVGGEPAWALDLLFSPDPDGEDTFYQENWYVLRGETLYQVQLLAEDPEDTEAFHELLRTWEWPPVEAEDPTGGSEGVSGGIFVEAHMATEADTSLDAPDRSTFTSTFGPDTTQVYVVFRLQPGTSGRVNITWRMEGDVILQSETNYSEDTNWASASIYYSGGEFLAPGSYEVELDVEETGDRVVVPFTIEDA